MPIILHFCRHSSKCELFGTTCMHITCQSKCNFAWTAAICVLILHLVLVHSSCWSAYNYVSSQISPKERTSISPTIPKLCKKMATKICYNISSNHNTVKTCISLLKTSFSEKKPQTDIIYASTRKQIFCTMVSFSWLVLYLGSRSSRFIKSWHGTTSACF